MRERSTAFFGRGGRLLARDYRLENGDRQAISPKGCEFPYRHEYSIHADVAAALGAARLLAVVQAAGANVAKRP